VFRGKKFFFFSSSSSSLLLLCFLFTGHGYDRHDRSSPAASL